MRYIHEPAKDITVIGTYDVVIAGGGIAGIAAALSAARAGAKKVLLVEKQYALGGLATLGLVTIYLPLCDGCGNQVSYGICEELFLLSIKHGHEGRYPAAWLEDGNHEEKVATRFEVQYNPYVFAILAEQLLLQENVEILYGTSVCGAKVEDGSIETLFVENKSGRGAVICGSVVDATGDADVCELAGEKTVLYQPKNTLAAWYYMQDGTANRLKMLGFADRRVGETDGDNPKPLVNTRYSGIDAAELSRMTIDSHKATLADFLKSGDVDITHSLTAVAAVPQVRMTRRIDGVYTLDNTEHVHYQDSIGRIGDWRKRGPVYEIPFGALHGKMVKNLITAGRCISVSDEMWDITRVIPACAVTGEAAGVAAALTQDFAGFDAKEIKKYLDLR